MNLLMLMNHAVKIVRHSSSSVLINIVFGILYIIYL